MRKRLGILGLSLASLMLSLASHAAEPKDFDLKQIQTATAKLIAALEDPDPTAWVTMYSEDAVVLEAGSDPLEGREQLLGLAKSMQPMSSVVITPSRTEGHGNIAYMYGTASWVNGRPPKAGSQSRVHLVIVWRKESDGQWRVAQESLVPDTQSEIPPDDSPRPTPAAAQATTIGSAEIKAALQLNEAGALADSVLRVLPIESRYNVGVSVVRRSQVDGKTPPDAIVHEAITEVYQIIEGKGVLVTGGTLESPTPFPKDGQIVRQIVGPSSFGKVILGGTRREVGTGDIVVIPPNTAHGFAEISTKRIVYTLIRIDPQQILELRGEPD